jgi:predicted transcriptional regulator
MASNFKIFKESKYIKYLCEKGILKKETIFSSEKLSAYCLTNEGKIIPFQSKKDQTK